jgi:hypothetical protein
MAIVAFDIDGCIIDIRDDKPKPDIILLLRWFQQNHHRVIVWSGGGGEYAMRWCVKFNLNPDVICSKTKEMAAELNPDICFDDEAVELAKVNIRVSPVNPPNVLWLKEHEEHYPEYKEGEATPLHTEREEGRGNP